MADIKKAAKWMQEGKRVRRAAWRPGLKTGFDDMPYAHPEFATSLVADDKSRIIAESGAPGSFLVTALLAHDWELVPELAKGGERAVARRIQRRRTKGWKMPEGAVYVGRPTVWGNPWKVFLGKCDCGHDEDACGSVMYRCHSAEAAIRLYRAHINGLKRLHIKAKLRGKDLACWCSLDKPCHADVLLEIANAGDD